jgi:hypothetical protein
MKYRVYADHKSHLHVVKRGFAWPAFLIPEVWLFLRGLRLDAAIALALIVGIVVATPPDLAGWLVLAVRIGAGVVANPRIESGFRSRGWRRLSDVEAGSVADALSKAGEVPAPGGLTRA